MKLDMAAVKQYLVMISATLTRTRRLWAGWVCGSFAAASVEICERILVAIWGWYDWLYVLIETIRLFVRGVLGFALFTAVQYWLCYVLGGRGSYRLFASNIGYTWLPLIFAAVIITPLLAWFRVIPVIFLVVIGIAGIYSVTLGVPIMRKSMALGTGKSILAYALSLAFGFFLFQIVF